MNLSRRRFRLVLRQLLVLGLACVMALQPVLATMGEIHELSHGLVESHLHDADHASVADEVVAQGERDDGAAGALHALHHFAHCCGHSVVIPPVLGVPAAIAPDVPLLALSVHQVTASPLLAPFRPPIQA